MSPTALRAVFGSCLTLGLVDLAWLETNAVRIGKGTSSPPLVWVDPRASVVEHRGSAEPPPVRVRELPTQAASGGQAPSAAPEKPVKQEASSNWVIQFERSLSV